MKTKILLVDDDPLVLKTLQNLLMREGFELQSAKSAQEAKGRLEQTTPNLIICDIRMPQQDGISFIKNLREGSFGRPNSDIPVIFITGYASEDAPVDAVKLGSKDYILKPFDMDELLKSIRNAIA